VPEIGKNYDADVVAVNHKEYVGFDESYFQTILATDGLVVDLKGLYRGKIKTLGYWSL
jgi:UDP-N-acetyl-D-galactosamine dehydrogenase